MGLFDRFKKPAVNEDGQQVVKVTVDGGYQPETVRLAKGVPAKLGFEAELPLNQEVSFDVKTDQRGEYDFACGMDMFKGKVVVK